MKVYISNNIEALAAIAAEAVTSIIEKSPNPVLGVATGSSPLSIYGELSRRVANGYDMSSAMAFALDEYVGINAHHAQSYVEVIRREVQVPLGLKAGRVFVPDGRAADLAQACADYEKAIGDAGGIDLQILGIGSNGHIGFNEPSSSLASRTREVALMAETRIDNARFFDSIDQVPARCLTQGIGTILEAREIVLMAQGARKAEAVASMVEGPVSASCPASALQLHPEVTVLLDEAAATKLRFAAYYRSSYPIKNWAAAS